MPVISCSTLDADAGFSLQQQKKNLPFTEKGTETELSDGTEKS